MRVLCAIGLRGGPEMVRRVLAVAGTRSDLVLLHVIDAGPHHELERLRSPLRPRPPHGPARDRAIGAAEEEAGRQALDEAAREAEQHGLRPVMRLTEGRPAEMITAVARGENVDLIAIRARERDGHPPRGPGSVGHTARYVLDHAACDVLLLREVL